MFHHIILTHLKSLRHHVVGICQLVYGSSHTQGNQTTEQEDDDTSHNETEKDDECHGRYLTLYLIRMEPLVTDIIEFTILFQAGIFVIYDIDEFLVVANDTEFTCRDVNLFEGNAVEIQFPDLAGQRHLTPYEILIASGSYVCQGIFRRMIFNNKRPIAHLLEAQGGIVVVLHHQDIPLA